MSLCQVSVPANSGVRFACFKSAINCIQRAQAFVFTFKTLCCGFCALFHCLIHSCIVQLTSSNFLLHAALLNVNFPACNVFKFGVCLSSLLPTFGVDDHFPLLHRAPFISYIFIEHRS